MKSWLLVFIQFAALAFIFLTGPLFAANSLLLFLELAGVALGIWAILAQGIGNFSFTPEPIRGAHLVTRGPYALIRHPMYAALLLTTLPLVVSLPSVARIVVWLVLLADLLIKLNYEEGLLAKKFSDYASYRARTFRLIPFLF